MDDGQYISKLQSLYLDLISLSSEFVQTAPKLCSKVIQSEKKKKLEIEGTLSVFVLTKTPRHDCCFVLLRYFIYINVKRASLSIFLWT